MVSVKFLHLFVNLMAILPDSLDEGSSHESATDEFEDRAAEQTDEVAPSLWLEVQFFQTSID